MQPAREWHYGSMRAPLAESRATVVQRLLDDIGALPGVTSVGITQNAFIPRFSYQKR